MLNKCFEMFLPNSSFNISIKESFNNSKTL